MEESRTMIPFSLKCTRCGTYTGKGTKANAKKEVVEGETYMGIKVLRFYVKCIVCANQITFKTDPKNSSYICESGAIRNYESQLQEVRDERAADIEIMEANEAKAAGHKDGADGKDKDAMQALENRTISSKLEMDVMDALDEIKAMNQRHERVDTQALLARVGGKGDVVGADGLTEADEELLRSVNFGKARVGGVTSRNGDVGESSDSEEERAPKSRVQDNVFAATAKAAAARPKESTTLGLKAVVVSRKRKADDSDSSAQPPVAKLLTGTSVGASVGTVSAVGSALGGIGGYASSDSD